MGLAEVLAAHEPHTAQGGVFCECGEWERYYDGLGSDETYAAHIATAVLAWLETVAQDEAVLRSCEDAIDQTYDHRDSDTCCGGLTWSTTDAESAAATLTAFLAAAKDAR